jgi:hypothetical protein
MSATPSRIARRVAGALWPDVQAQRKVAPGTFGFTCAGHGGLIAVAGAAPFDEATVQRFRDYGRTELVVTAPGRAYTSVTYTKDSLRELAERYEAATLYEVIVGEEDCDWALLAWESEEIREGMATAGYFSRVATREEVLETVERWNPRWLGIEPTGPEVGEGEAIMRAAWGDWHERVPEGATGVFVEYADGREAYGIVPRAAYEGTERRGSHPISTQTVIDVIDLEEVERL